MSSFVGTFFVCFYFSDAMAAPFQRKHENLIIKNVLFFGLFVQNMKCLSNDFLGSVLFLLFSSPCHCSTFELFPFLSVLIVVSLSLACKMFSFVFILLLRIKILKNFPSRCATAKPKNTRL